MREREAVEMFGLHTELGCSAQAHYNRKRESEGQPCSMQWKSCWPLIPERPVLAWGRVQNLMNIFIVWKLKLGPGKYGGANGIFPEPASLCRKPECTHTAHLSASRPIGQESLLIGQHSCRNSCFRIPAPIV